MDLFISILLIFTWCKVPWFFTKIFLNLKVCLTKGHYPRKYTQGFHFVFERQMIQESQQMAGGTKGA